MAAHPVWIILALVIGGALALAGLARPFLGLLIVIVMHFIQPAEFIPALNPLHIERTYAILVLASFLVYRLSHPGPPLLKNGIIRASFILLGAACLSVPFAVWRGGAFNYTADMTKSIIMLVLLAGLADTNERLRNLHWILVGLLIWFAGSGMIAYFQGNSSMQEGIERAAGVNSIAGHPNELAGLILALLNFTTPLLRASRGVLVRGFLLFCAGLGIATLVLTGARICFIGLAVAILYFVLRSRHRAISFGVVVVLAIATWIAMPQSYRMRYLTVAHYAQGGQLDASNEFRLRIWRIGWRMFLDNPVLGVGAGQFPTAFGTTYATRLHQAWMQPHNLLLEVLCEMGIVGIICFTYFLIQIFKQVRKISWVEDDSPLRFNYFVSLGCGGMMLALVVISTVSHTLFRPYWYLLGGISAANWRIVQAALGVDGKTSVEDTPLVQRSELAGSTLGHGLNY